MKKGYKKTWDAEIIAHWHKPFDGFHTSAQDFYTAVEQAITKRELTQVRFDRVAWKENGILSADREYLRVEWRRYIYDICSAPVGTGCFFSSWLVLSKAKLTAPNLLGTIVAIIIILYFIQNIYIPILVIIGLYLLATQLAAGNIQVGPQLEEFLNGLTVLGPIMEVFFRRATYYQIDTASMFQSVVHTAILEVVDGITEQKGVPRLSEDERAPIMRDFFHK